MKAALALASALLIISCGGTKAAPALPAATGSSVQRSGVQQVPPPATASQAAPVNPVLATQDAVTQLIAEAERHFAAGQSELKQGHLASARAEFDRAVGVLIESSQGAKSDPRLRAEYEQLLGRISALEAAALRQGDGCSES
jgi:hypothetical protein